MMFDTFRQDLRVGARVLVKERGFCLLAVAVLALGICAVTTQFAVVNGALLRGFAFPAANRLVDVLMVDPTNFSPANFNSQLTTADFAEMKEQQRSFEGFSAYLNGSTVNLSYRGQPVRLQGAYISHDFFHTLGVTPAKGRDFTPEDDRPGAAKTVILSDALWRANFGADEGVLGRTVRVNGATATIVGIMPPRFSFPTNEQIWIPLNTEFPVKPRNDRGINGVAAVGRLRPGVDPGQANAEIDAIAKRFAAAYPDTNKAYSVGWVRPLIAAFTGPQLEQLLYTMLGFCLGVLLIACVNVMNMQFARATLRAKELAIRSSLGATRTRLIRQMLTESLLLAMLGALVGIAAAFWATDFLQHVTENVPNPPPAWVRFTIDGPVLAFVVGAMLLAAVVSGLVPAWLASRANAADTLKESGRGNTGRAVGLITRGLVIFQIVVTCVLLIASLLQVQSIRRQQAIDYGYDTGAVVSARLGLFEGDYPSNQARRLFYDRLLRELRAAPEVESAALTNRFRMVFSGSSFVEIEGRAYPNASDRPNSQFENVTPGYFDTLGLKLTQGRDFTDDDNDQKHPVAIVNAAFARKHFGAESPLGRRFRTAAQDGSNPGPWRTIVGVARDARMQGPFNTQADGTGYYVPYYATPFGAAADEAVASQFGTILARPRGGAAGDALAAVVRRVSAAADPNLPLYFVGTPRDNIDSFLGQNRIVAAMFSVFGAVAMLLAAVGLYGVMSFAVNQRTQEFGIRMALGADTSRILGMVLRQGAWQLGIGLALGLGLALLGATVGAQAIGNLLFEVSPRDPATYLVVSGLLAFVALGALLIPARRAARVDPMIALRSD